MNLPGKSILLTGASSGIGYELAAKLAKENCRVALLARNIEKLNEIVGRFGSERNILLPLRCDVTRREEVHSSIDKVMNTFGGIDMLILNAGLSRRIDAEDFTSEQGEEILSVNLISQFYFLEKLIPHFVSKKEGVIAGVSSLSDVRGFPRSGFYSASKAAFTRLLESLRTELNPYNIKVITIRPGFVQTPMTDKNEFHMPFLMKPDKAADIIINGLKKDKRIIQFPFPTVMGTRLIKILPDFLVEFFSRKHLEGLKEINY